MTLYTNNNHALKKVWKDYPTDYCLALQAMRRLDKELQLKDARRKKTVEATYGLTFVDGYAFQALWNKEVEALDAKGRMFLGVTLTEENIPVAIMRTYSKESGNKWYCEEF